MRPGVKWFSGTREQFRLDALPDAASDLHGCQQQDLKPGSLKSPAPQPLNMHGSIRKGIDLCRTYVIDSGSSE